MNEIKLTGGARIGMANATWPLATLKVNSEKLELNAGIIGNMSFQASDIISLEPYKSLPFIGKGIKINHKVASYNERVIFWTFQDPSSLIKQIQETGFLNQTEAWSKIPNEKLIAKQSQGAFPLKMSFAIGMIVIWNLLFLVDIIPFLILKTTKLPLGIGALSALGIVFLSAFLSLVSADFRGLILKEGRELDDIKKFAIFVMIISGFMLFNISLLAIVFG